MSDLVGENAKEVQRVRMLGILREDFPVTDFRLPQVAGRVVSPRGFQGLGDGDVGHEMPALYPRRVRAQYR